MNSKYYFLLLLLIFFSCSDVFDDENIYGCTDKVACNYNENATELWEGSCEYPIGTCNCDDLPIDNFCDCEGNIDSDFDGLCDNIDNCIGQYSDGYYCSDLHVLDDFKNDNIGSALDSMSIFEIIECDDVVHNNDTPLAAAKKKNTSMWQAINDVKEKKSNVIVSAGNTGALFVISKLSINMIENISKPALAALWPNKIDMNIVLDLGANVECDEKNFDDFALMGAALHNALFPSDKSKVALLNIGSEEIKGHEISDISLEDKINMCKKHFLLLKKDKNEQQCINLAKKHFSYYLKGFKNASKWRKYIMLSNCYSDIIENIDSMENEIKT